MVVHVAEKSPVPVSPSTPLTRAGVSEHYAALLSRVGWPGKDGQAEIRTLGLTSAVEGEGVSTIATHLALAAAAHLDKTVLLVDAHVADPTIHNRLRLNLTPGFSEWLESAGGRPDAAQRLTQPNLWVLTAGKAASSHSRGHDVRDLSGAVKELLCDFDLVIFDLPPAGRSSFALRLASVLDAVVLVVEADRVAWDVARRANELLRRSGAQVLGAVLNKRAVEETDGL